LENIFPYALSGFKDFEAFHCQFKQWITDRKLGELAYPDLDGPPGTPHLTSLQPSDSGKACLCAILVRLKLLAQVSSLQIVGVLQTTPCPVMLSVIRSLVKSGKHAIHYLP
jgi:hypothetical protein